MFQHHRCAGQFRDFIQTAQFGALQDPAQGREDD